MDLDPGLWSRRHGSVRIVYRIYRALAGTVGTGRFWRTESFEFADFSRRLLERMAIDDHFVGGAGARDRSRIRASVLPQARASRIRSCPYARGILRGAIAAARLGLCLGDTQRRIGRCGPR